MKPLWLSIELSNLKGTFRGQLFKRVGIVHRPLVRSYEQFRRSNFAEQVYGCFVGSEIRRSDSYLRCSVDELSQCIMVATANDLRHSNHPLLSANTFCGPPATGCVPT